MTGEVEAAGDVLTGAIVAGAVDGASGKQGPAAHGGTCLNCGATVDGAYCASCGQRTHLHRSLLHLGHDILHGVFHFAGRMWRTLPELFFHPGRLTRRYIDGERAKFVSPMALFLFSVFLMFAVASFSSGLSPRIDPSAPAQLKKSIETNDRQLADLRSQRDAAIRAGRSTASFDQKIIDLERDSAIMRGVQAGEIGRIAKTQINAPEWLSKPIEKAAGNPDLLFYKLKTNAYKFS